MANQVETLVASYRIKTPADKYYNFFKFNLTDIVKIYPAVYNSAEIISGELGVAGTILFWHYTIADMQMTMRMLIEAVDDDRKTMKLTVLEGDVLQLYKSFACTLKVCEGLGEWIIEYERASPITPTPDIYAAVLTNLLSLVDAYLLVE